MYIIHKWTLFPLRRTYLDSTCLQSDNISTNFRLAPFHFTRRFAWTLKLVSLSELRLQQEMSLFWRVWSDRTFEKTLNFLQATLSIWGNLSEIFTLSANWLLFLRSQQLSSVQNVSIITTVVHKKLMALSPLPTSFFFANCWLTTYGRV